MTEAGTRVLELVRELLADEERLLEAVDEVLLNTHDRQDADLTREEIQLLKIAYANDDEFLRKNMRMREDRRSHSRAVLAIERAGTREQFQAARDDLEVAERAYAVAFEAMVEAEDLATRQERRERSRVAERALNTLQRQVDAMQHARDELREMCPTFARQILNQFQRSEEHSELNQQENRLRNRLENVPVIAKLRLDRDEDLQAAIRYAENNLSTDHPAYPTFNNTFGRKEINRQAWAAYVADEESDQPVIEAELKELQRRRRHLEQKAAECLSYYSEKYGL